MPQAARGLLQLSLVNGQRRITCFNAASGKRSVATLYFLSTRHKSATFQCRKRQEVCCNRIKKFLTFMKNSFQCRKRQEVCCNTVSWKPHEHWPENEVLDNLHEKAPIWHFFRVDTVSFSCEKLASAPAVEGFNVSMICLDNLPPFWPVFEVVQLSFSIHFFAWFIKCLISQKSFHSYAYRQAMCQFSPYTSVPSLKVTRMFPLP